MALLATGLLACDARPDRESAAGSTVTTVPLTATRVVSLVPSLAELMVTIGAGDLIVARTDYDTHPAVVPLPSVGGGLDPSLEAL
ncbi:MAG: hemin ABC transporter substrate-binding protein, partial [Longimicrobiales bacterium]